MQVCLFDIDGTLLNTGGAGQTAMIAAVEEEFGVNEPLHGISAAGRTDRAIAMDVFAFYGLPFDEDAYDRFHQCYLSLLPAHLRMSKGRTLPGIRELLDQLSTRTDMLLGLLTGNFQGGAWHKLQHYELHHYFDFGGFGDRHLNRDDVARDAFQLIQHRLGHDFSPSDVWVIGDTPSDIRCARAIGANAVGVATGIHSRQELEADPPDLLLDDLTDLKQFLKFLML